MASLFSGPPKAAEAPKVEAPPEAPEPPEIKDESKVAAELEQERRERKRKAVTTASTAIGQSSIKGKETTGA